MSFAETRTRHQSEQPSLDNRVDVQFLSDFLQRLLRVPYCMTEVREMTRSFLDLGKFGDEGVGHPSQK